MISSRLRRRAFAAERASEEGPFVSFTDLFIGILFLFLILVAALMLIHLQTVRMMQEEIERLQRVIDAQTKLEAERPPFRLGIIFNIYQRPSESQPWTYSRTVRIFRSPDDHCVNTVILRSNLSTAWKPPVEDSDVPDGKDQNLIKDIPRCGMSGRKDRWDSGSEVGEMDRVSPTLYEGTAMLYKPTGATKIYMQYRVLGVYDDYFKP